MKKKPSRVLWSLNGAGEQFCMWDDQFSIIYPSIDNNFEMGFEKLLDFFNARNFIN